MDAVCPAACHGPGFDPPVSRALPGTSNHSRTPMSQRESESPRPSAPTDRSVGEERWGPTERRKALAALRAQEQQYRAIFDGSIDGMVLWDEDLRVVDVNDAFVRMTGLT